MTQRAKGGNERFGRKGTYWSTTILGINTRDVKLPRLHTAPRSQVRCATDEFNCRPGFMLPSRNAPNGARIRGPVKHGVPEV